MRADCAIRSVRMSQACGRGWRITRGRRRRRAAFIPCNRRNKARGRTRGAQLGSSRASLVADFLRSRMRRRIWSTRSHGSTALAPRRVDHGAFLRSPPRHYRIHRGQLRRGKCSRSPGKHSTKPRRRGRTTSRSRRRDVHARIRFHVCRATSLDGIRRRTH